MYQLLLQGLTTHHVGPIDLTLQGGECIGISGHSGSGKSLLLRAIADLDPFEGVIRFNGHRHDHYPPSQWRRQLAYFATESSWWDEQVIDHFPTDHGEQLAHWLDLAKIDTKLLHQSPERLSTGERQRLAILRHLLHHPAVLLLDEPTSSLDHQATAGIESLLHHYQQQSQAILIWVSHNPEQLQRNCPRRYHLDRGKLEPLT